MNPTESDVLSKDELARWKSSIVNKRTAFRQQLGKRLDKFQRFIRTYPHAEQFSSPESTKEYLFQQQGTDPVPIAKWWRDNYEMQEHRWAIDESCKWISSYAAYCREDRRENKDRDDELFDEETKRLLDARGKFISVFDKRIKGRGTEFIDRIEKDILFHPFDEPFKDMNTLIEHANRSARYDELRTWSPEIALDGMQYLMEFADRERKSRQTVKVASRLSRWKKPRIASNLEKDREPPLQSISDADQAYEHPSFGTLLPVSQNLGPSGEALFQYLTADASVNPFRDQYRDQDTLRGYLSRPVPQELSYAQGINPDIKDHIGGLVSAYARGQRDTQALLRKRIDPDDGLSEAQTLQEALTGLGAFPDHCDFAVLKRPHSIPNIQPARKEGALAMVLPQKVERQEERTTATASQSGATHGEDEKSKSFRRDFGSEVTLGGMGKQGIRYLTRIGDYMSGAEFRAEKFENKDVTRAFLSLSKWDFSGKFKMKQPELYERLVDNVYRYAQKRIQRDQEQDHRGVSGLRSSAKPQTEERLEEDRIKWSIFRADFMDSVTGHGSKGASQVYNLESDLRKPGTDLTKYMTEEGVKSMLTQPRQVAYRRLETAYPDQARDFLGYGVYLANQIHSGEDSSRLIMNQKDLAYIAADQKALDVRYSFEESATSSGRKRQRESSSAERLGLGSSRSTSNPRRASVLPFENTHEPGLRAAEASIASYSVEELPIASGFDLSSDDIPPDLNIFDSEEMKIHRLILFGLY